MERKKRNSNTYAVRFGQAMRETRKAEGKTLAELSERLDFLEYPMSVNTLSKIERGERTLELDDAKVIAAALDRTMDEMTAFTGEKDPDAQKVYGPALLRRFAAMRTLDHFYEAVGDAREVVDRVADLKQ